ncbi:4226_t:CDS:1, partial [Racocetra persica]
NSAQGQHWDHGKDSHVGHSITRRDVKSSTQLQVRLGIKS